MARRRSTPRRARKWKISKRARARSTTRTRRRATSTRSSSGRRRWPNAATARTTAWTTASGSRSGPKQPGSAGAAAEPVSTTGFVAPAGGSARTRLSAALFRRPWLRGGLLLSGPLAWFVLIYLAALVVLFISSLWSVDSFTGNLVHSWTLDNFKTLVDVPTYRTIALRTIGIAAAVTVTDAILAVPFALFAVRIASRRLRAALVVAVLIRLWSSYLVRVYVWRLILSKNGVLNWVLGKIGLGALNIGYSNWAIWIVFSYI